MEHMIWPIFNIVGAPRSIRSYTKHIVVMLIHLALRALYTLGVDSWLHRTASLPIVVFLGKVVRVGIGLARDHMLPVCFMLKNLPSHSNLLAHDELIHAAVLFNSIIQAFGIGELAWNTLSHVAIYVVASLLPSMGT